MKALYYHQVFRLHLRMYVWYIQLAVQTHKYRKCDHKLVRWATRLQICGNTIIGGQHVPCSQLWDGDSCTCGPLPLMSVLYTGGRIRVAGGRLHGDESLNDRTVLSPDEVLPLLRFCHICSVASGTLPTDIRYCHGLPSLGNSGQPGSAGEPLPHFHTQFHSGQGMWTTPVRFSPLIN